MTRFEPMGDYVLIEKDVAEEKVSPGGIVLKKEHQDNPDTATVIGVGPSTAEMRVSADVFSKRLGAGDKVVVSKFAGVNITLDEEPFTVIHFDDILGLVYEEDDDEG